MQIIKRSAVVFLWILLLFCALYWPRLKIFKYEANSINVFAWGDILDPEMIKVFEEETGIHVHLNYYTSNEELLVKMKATGGYGYDLIIPSDYTVKILAREGLLKELDQNRLPMLKNVNPLLLNHSFDPENRYSIPFEWEVFGFGINREFFEHHPLDDSWDAIFKEPPYRITTTNDPVHAILVAAYYLFGPVETLTKEQILKVKELLIAQKKWVEAYADFRGDYFLATRNCPLVVSQSSYIWRSKKKFPFIDFVIPKGNSFLSIENLSIPDLSEKEDLVYKFMEFLYRPESIASHYKTYGFFPPTLNALDLLDLDEETKAFLNSNQERLQSFNFTRPLLSEQEIRDLWIEIKSN